MDMMTKDYGKTQERICLLDYRYPLTQRYWKGHLLGVSRANSTRMKNGLSRLRYKMEWNGIANLEHVACALWKPTLDWTGCGKIVWLYYLTVPTLRNTEREGTEPV